VFIPNEDGCIFAQFPTNHSSTNQSKEKAEIIEMKEEDQDAKIWGECRRIGSLTMITIEQEDRR